MYLRIREFEYVLEAVVTASKMNWFFARLDLSSTPYTLTFTSTPASPLHSHQLTGLLLFKTKSHSFHPHLFIKNKLSKKDNNEQPASAKAYRKPNPTDLPAPKHTEVVSQPDSNPGGRRDRDSPFYHPGILFVVINRGVMVTGTYTDLTK
jgi:hypothetical protein